MEDRVDRARDDPVCRKKPRPRPWTPRPVPTCTFCSDDGNRTLFNPETGLRSAAPVSDISVRYRADNAGVVEVLSYITAPSAASFGD